MVETPKYEVSRRLDGVEIRKYPQMFLATAKGDADLFGILFRYITGANKGSNKISMTAPVITPEKISDDFTRFYGRGINVLHRPLKLHKRNHP